MINPRKFVYVTALVGALCVVLSAAPPSRNLLSNGDFEKWLDADAESPGWHTRLTSFIPIPVYADPQNKKGRTGKYQFKCGCGHIWGTVRPWTQLYCLECKQMNTGLEDSGDLYLDNHKYVSRTEGKSGRGVQIKMPAEVGNAEGVRVISELIRAERGSAYEISFDAIAKGTHLRVFVECFREMPDDKEATEWVKSLPAECNPLKQTCRLKRVFRKQVNVESPQTWTHFVEPFAAPQRSEFDWMSVTLYAYLPGEAAYDNVELRKLTDREAAEYHRDNTGPKDERLR